MAPRMPLDIWLLVFDELDDRAFLWSTCRNISHFFRDCVDGYLRHGLSQNWLVDLLYSDFHTRKGPLAYDIHVPMVFDRFSDDGARVFFQQRAYRDLNERHYKGSVRGWVPFIERYCEETRKPTPKVLNKSKPSDGFPLWEEMHTHWRNSLSGDEKKSYLSHLRHAVSIGRGDHPPYYIRIFNAINDTELVDLEIDCKQREISFAWRETYAMFFREQDFAVRAYNSQRKKRVHDVELAACDDRSHLDRSPIGPLGDNHHLRARRKRLASWVAKNKRRMSPEMRWWTENAVYGEKRVIRRILRHDNLCEVAEAAADEVEEIVPARLADDHPDLLLWPWVDDNRSFAPKNHLRCGPTGCVIL